VNDTAVATRPDGAALAEQVVISGDLSKLTAEQRMAYYTATCDSLGLNPLTRPFEFITLNGKLTLYATKGCTDQLRSIRKITITALDPRQVGELYVVVATGRDGTGREDSSTGAVSIKGLGGENLANAMMKAETKAKRRLTLSLAGLGLSDESEIGSIPNAQPADVDPETGEIRRPPSLAERAAARAEAVEAVVVEAEPERAAEAVSGGLDDPALWTEAKPQADPPPLTKEQIRELLKGAGITPAEAMDRAAQLWPGFNPRKEMTDRQRGILWDSFA